MNTIGIIGAMEEEITLIKNAMVIEKGHIRSQSIWNFRETRGLICK